MIGAIVAIASERVFIAGGVAPVLLRFPSARDKFRLAAGACCRITFATYGAAGLSFLFGVRPRLWPVPCEREHGAGGKRQHSGDHSSYDHLVSVHTRLRRKSRTPQQAGAVFALPPLDRKSTRLNSSHVSESRMPSSA